VAGPVAQGPVECNPLPGADVSLAIERNVVTKFRDDDLSDKQASVGNPPGAICSGVGLQRPRPNAHLAELYGTKGDQGAERRGAPYGTHETARRQTRGLARA